jgi:hypothetical protein
MVQPRVYEGTWQELSAHADEFKSYPRLTLIVPTPETQNVSRYRADLTPQERIRLMDAFTEANQGLPLLSDEAFDRENLYGDDQE